MRTIAFSRKSANRAGGSRPGVHRGRLRRRGAALAVIAALGLSSLAAGTASAEPGDGVDLVGEGIRISGVTAFGETWLGAVGSAAGVDALSWCIQAGMLSPTNNPIVAQDIVNDAALAYVIGAHQDENTAVSRAAIAYLVHVRHDIGSNGITGEQRRAAVDANTPQHVKDLAAQYLAEAEQNSGPYVSAAGTPQSADQRTGSINGIGLKSEAGAWIAGKPVTITLNGPAIFDATGTNAWSGTTGSEPLSLGWTAIGNGTVTGSMKIEGLGRTTLTRIDAGGNVQQTLTYGNRPAGLDPTETTTPLTPFDVIFDFQPAATTQVQADVVEAGDALIDTLNAFAVDDPWVAIGGQFVPVDATVTWYGPFSTPQAQQDTIPAGAPVVGSEQVTFTGPGDYISPGTVIAPGDGFFTAVVSISKTAQGNSEPYVRDDFTAPFFEEAETAVAKADIEHRSTAREYNVAPGGQAFDTIEIDDLPVDHTDFEGLGKWAADVDVAQVRVYGPMESAPSTIEVPEGAPVFYETEVPAVNGTFDIGYDESITLPQTSTYATGDHYVFVYHFAGDARVNEFASPFNDVRERFFVPGPQEPNLPAQVVTQATPEVKVGEPFEDTALVTGNPAEGDYLVFEAFGPQDPSGEPVCTEEEVFFTSEQVEVTGAGYYTSGETTVARGGNVYWVETLYDAEGNVKHRGECGIPSETTKVIDEPWVTTKAASDHGDKPVVGDDIWDTVQTGGTFPEGTVIEVGLFYAPEGQDLVCTDPIWVSEKIEIVDGVTEYETNSYRTDKPGTYGFVERTIDAEGKIISRGECGEASETLVVDEKPTPPTSPNSEQPGKPGALATTGVSIGLAVVLAVLLLGAGITAVVIRRRHLAAAVVDSTNAT